MIAVQIFKFASRRAWCCNAAHTGHMSLSFSIANIITIFQERLLPRLSIRFDRSPIDSTGKLAHFIHTRSAYVAQTSLFGYLKTRMGTKFRDMFMDDTYVKSINLAKWRVFAASLSDLTVFATAIIAKDAALSGGEAGNLARDVFARCVQDTFADCDDAGFATIAVNAFAERLNTVMWPNAAIGEAAFTQSPKDLIAWAPIADELKRHDELIVRNSIRFRWRDIRNQLKSRLSAEAIADEWRNGRAPA